MIVDVVTLGCVTICRRPPNKKWIFGYGKIETVFLSFRMINNSCLVLLLAVFSSVLLALFSYIYPFVVFSDVGSLIITRMNF